jgi:hypothetical protein
MAEVPAAFRRPNPRGEDRKVDPLRFCVAATVAAISWLITPPLSLTLFAALGLVMYGRARRAGLLKSRCLIGDTRLVMVYLALLFVTGVFFTVRSLL